MTTVAAVVGALAVTTVSNAAATELAAGTKLYIVETVGNPLASYAGGVSGFAATRPLAGGKINAGTSNARAYREHLRSQHDNALRTARIAASAKTLDYGVTFNGFAARLTDTEATRLAHTAGIAQVWKNEIRSTDTISTPAFLGLSGNHGVWNDQFGDVKHAGEGIIIGDIDSGLWPENPTFGALKNPKDAATIAAKFHGICDAGSPGTVTPAPAFSCNNKVIGGRFYNQTGLAQPYEFLSPRDYDGHGSHTASTAAGDNNVPASINGLALGTASGMAPVARISVYKALWHNNATGTSSGGTVDLVAAIDDAVADGVDVINYSVSGSSDLVVDPTEIAFYNAAAAGVFVATSAGNSGPGASTVAHNSPWLTTVAASSHDRSTAKTVTLGDGTSYPGVGVGPGVGPKPLIDAATAGLPGAPAGTAALCFSDADNNPSNGITPVLDPAKITGKIVLCQRGTNARVDKSLAVLNAGGVGMIQFNPTANSLNADFHSVPSIHVDQVAGAAIKAYAATANPTATISAVLAVPIEAPMMAGFSSRGPALAGGGDLLKPDITAPGVDVIAAVAPPNNGGNIWGDLSGTSMSSPHIAGIAALIMSKHPDWSPMWVKSALMTTASTVDNQGQPIQNDSGGTSTPLDYGSGHVTPKNAFDPGLVYDSTPSDWAAYGCALGQFQLITAASFCAGLPKIDPSDLNYPSIAVGDLAGTQTIRRTVTNITNKKQEYKAKVTAPPGFTVTVSPTAFTLKKGTSVTYTVKLTRTTATLGSYAFGSLTWKGDDGTKVTSPIAVRPVAVAAPPSATFSGTSGSGTVQVRAGYTGTMTTAVDGLVPATVGAQLLDPMGPGFNPNSPAASSATERVDVTVPAGTTTARFATFAADYPANTDVDIFVYSVVGSTLTLVGQSAGGTADETVTLTSPAAGTYAFFANLFASPTGPLTVNADTWLLNGTAAGNLTATPSQSVTTGALVNVALNWSGLTAGNRYLGVLTFGDGTSAIGKTFVNVNS